MNKIIIGGVFLAMAGVAYYEYNRYRQLVKNWYLSKVEVLDGKLEFSSIVSFFRTLNLDKEIHIPFACREGGKGFSKFFGSKSFPEHKDGYQTIFIGVYNEKKNEIEAFKVIYAKELDDKTVDVFGNEYLVVLN